MKKFQSLFVLLFSFSFLLIFSSCKTQEDIRREKTVENLNEQVAQNQKSSANANSRFMSLEEELAKLTGKIEETAHNRQQENKESSAIKERLLNLEETNKKQTEYIKALNEKIQDQSKYIEQVIASLSSINNQKESKAESSPAQPASVKSAIAKYKAQDLAGSKELFISFLDNKKLKKKDKEASLYYLGMIEYKEKNYEESRTYFSKLFSESPASTYGASTLLFLAKAFIQLKSKEEAGQSLDELITRFPKSKEAQEGAKLKTKI